MPLLISTIALIVSLVALSIVLWDRDRSRVEANRRARAVRAELAAERDRCSTPGARAAFDRLTGLSGQ